MAATSLPARLKRLARFAGIWLAGVAVLAVIAFVLRRVLRV
ncbi:MAG: DUF2474 domain-containing protein [Xanthomonadaceae bacterium]|nr:DUF2474 domain-containing protein [Xanthomonadaceae bacterium]